MLKLYSSAMIAGRPLIRNTLLNRGKKGKEDPARLNERMGIYEKQRPAGKLAWLHAASVGEAQSALILVKAILESGLCDNILVTTGTVTSARLMEKRLPPGAFHQFFPVDHPRWVGQFLDHWRPDMALWMESELWPHMLQEIKKRHIPAALINARLSEKSFRRWRLARREISSLLGAFGIVLAQTESDAAFFGTLGAGNVRISGNLKYSAAPLPHDESALRKMKEATSGRPVWLYASTHDGEEDMACRIHRHLRKKFPSLLTILIPRHPERRNAVRDLCGKYSLTARLRGAGDLPQSGDDIYIADTMGETGLFYRLAPVACIGRSFSSDGGGGHNPIEAARLGCAVMHGPRVQNLAAVYEEMGKAGAVIALKDEASFQARLERILSDPAGLDALQEKAAAFVREKARVLDIVMAALATLTPETAQTSPPKAA